jgi:hypothetical protein
LYSRWRAPELRAVRISGKLWGDKMVQARNVHRVITAHRVGYLVIYEMKRAIKSTSALK